LARELELDIHRPTERDAVAQAWTQLRAEPGLCRFENYGGYYVAARYEDAMEVLMKPEIYGSGKGITLPPPDGIRSYHIPAEMDPPAHGEYRALIQPLLTPAKVRDMEPQIREIARELIADIPDDEPIDFVKVFARPLPIVVALGLMNIARDRAHELEQMVEDLHREVATGGATGASERLKAFSYQVLEDRKQARGPDDVVTAIIDGRVSGRALDADEQMSMVRQILVGGFDTTSIALATMAKWLAENPGERERLLGDLKLVDSFCEEVVRFSSPSTYLRREVMQPTELAGTRLQPGDSVVVAFGAANHDGRKFECPAAIVPDRKPNPHLGFGAGRHRCIGSFVAKAQMRIACEELLSAFPSFALVEGAPITYSTGLGQGIMTLPMRLGRSAR
jgi:cytochrome P450